MGERVLDQVEHLAVELGVGAVHLQFDLLVQFAGEVADDSRQLLPGIADRLHPRLHDAFLQFRRDVRQPLQRHLELGVLVAARDLQELIARQNQFRDHRHQMFQRVHVDADRLVGDLVALGHFGVGGRLFCNRLAGFFRFLAGFFLRRGGARRGFRLGRRHECGGHHFDRGFPEGALQLIERYFTRTQFAFQYLRHQGALRDRRCGGNGGCGRGRRSDASRAEEADAASAAPSRHRRHPVLDHLVQFDDQILIGALRLGLGRLKSGENFLDAVDARTESG